MLTRLAKDLETDPRRGPETATDVNDAWTTKGLTPTPNLWLFPVKSPDNMETYRKHVLT
jgi:hypothetical protein